MTGSEKLVTYRPDLIVGGFVSYFIYYKMFVAAASCT